MQPSQHAHTLVSLCTDQNLVFAEYLKICKIFKNSYQVKSQAK